MIEAAEKILLCVVQRAVFAKRRGAKANLHMMYKFHGSISSTQAQNISWQERIKKIQEREKNNKIKVRR